MTLTIHFLNVGHGDCVVIKHPSGRLSVIDINNGSELDETSAEELTKAYRLDSLLHAFEGLRTTKSTWTRRDQDRLLRDYETNLTRQAQQELVRKGYDITLTNPIEFLRTTYASDSVHRYIQTHPDMDHMRGITALTGEKPIVNVWDTDHNKSPEHFVSEQDEQDWQTYQKLTADSSDDCRVLHLYRRAKNAFFNQDPIGVDGGDSIEVLSPTPEVVNAANDAGKTNNLSYVLRVTYGGARIILAGDAEKEVWDDLVDTYGADLKCDILKASHHGRDSGYHQEAVKLMRPQLTVVSVGTKPETDASNKYRNYSDHVWSTRWRGDITVTVDDTGHMTLASQYDR